MRNVLSACHMTKAVELIQIPSHQMNWANSRNGFVIIAALSLISLLLINVSTFLSLSIASVQVIFGVTCQNDAPVFSQCF